MSERPEHVDFFPMCNIMSIVDPAPLIDNGMLMDQDMDSVVAAWKRHNASLNHSAADVLDDLSPIDNTDTFKPMLSRRAYSMMKGNVDFRHEG
jgi:hypothetical protein